ncbi:MAG: DUF5715 family protein [Bacteroidota bacterium]
MIKDKSIRKVFLYSIIGILIIFVFLYRGLLKYEVKSYINARSVKYSKCNNCKEYFPDDVATHEKALKANVIKPQKELSDLDQLKSKGILKELKTNDNYIVAEMDFAKPLVIPKVDLFLNELVALYKTELKELDYVRFEITSATRSRRSVRQLAGNNVNAITNSAHLKGKTIDISYVRFDSNTAQLKALIQALKKMRENNKCYVKYEKEQGCLHITVR